MEAIFYFFLSHYFPLSFTNASLRWRQSVMVYDVQLLYTRSVFQNRPFRYTCINVQNTHANRTRSVVNQSRGHRAVYADVSSVSNENIYCGCGFGFPIIDTVGPCNNLAFRHLARDRCPLWERYFARFSSS